MTTISILAKVTSTLSQDKSDKCSKFRNFKKKIEILEFQKKIEIPKKYFARFKFFFASPKNNGTIQLEKKSLFWEFKIKF